MLSLVSFNNPVAAHLKQSKNHETAYKQGEGNKTRTSVGSFVQTGHY
jgi:hypothetical protein